MTIKNRSIHEVGKQPRDQQFIYLFGDKIKCCELNVSFTLTATASRLSALYTTNNSYLLHNILFF